MKRVRQCLFLSVLLVFVSQVLEDKARADGPIFSDNFTSSYKNNNPWACADSSGLVTGAPGRQLVVDDSGAINNQTRPRAIPKLP